ncbi:MAG: peptidylprolyl isomerase [Oscillospiraceae bacterium]|nr:peptidylprolyl isomerase [Oscillospiraceae bacterium]
MSSANEKNARAAKQARRQQQMDEQERSSRSFKRKAIIVVAVVAVLLAASLVINSNLLQRTLPAVKVGSTSYSAAETDVFYRSTYNSYYSSYSSYIQSLFGSDTDVDSYVQMFTGLDRSVALDQQMYSEDQTWADYMMELTQENMQQVTALCEDASRNGYTLPQETLDSIETELSELEASAKQYGYSSLDQFLTMNYGKGVTADVMRSVMQKMETASGYAAQVDAARSYTDEQKEAYYAAHADELDLISYYSCLISSSNSAFDPEPEEPAAEATEETGEAEAAESAEAEAAPVEESAEAEAAPAEETAGEEVAEAAVYEAPASSSNLSEDGVVVATGTELSEEEQAARLAAARAAAERLSWSADPESFVAACAEYGTTPSLQTTAGENLPSALREWLVSPERWSGEMTSIETDSGAYAVCYMGRDNNDYLLRSMRHILVKTEADENGDYTDEAVALSMEKIRDIQDLWNADPTEEHFAQLAEEYSEDAGSNTNGGLYEDIQKGSMVDSIDSFLFAEGRAVGDTTVVEGSNGSYRGWHLVYYVGEGRNARLALAETPLHDSEQQAWLEDLISGYTLSTGSGLRYVKKS